MVSHRIGARAEYRLQQDQRIRDSVSLSKKFKKLKSLTVDLTYYSRKGATKNSHVKYTVNLAHAKSVFRFDCFNTECVGGDFDLSDKLASAVAGRLTTATGEICCQGWRSKATIGTVRCHNILRYTLSLAY